MWDGGMRACVGPGMCACSQSLVQLPFIDSFCVLDADQ